MAETRAKMRACETCLYLMAAMQLWASGRLDEVVVDE